MYCYRCGSLNSENAARTVAPAITGILGTSEQAAYTVIGETVNLAARLETQATPGNILVST